jgi:hypothetical protein
MKHNYLWIIAIVIIAAGCTPESPKLENDFCIEQGKQAIKVKKQVDIPLPQILQDVSVTELQSIPIEGYDCNGKFIPDGKVKVSYQDGQAALLGLFENGLSEGTWQTFYPDGSISSEVTYDKGVPQGKMIRYWQNGKVAREDTYSKGEITTSRVYEMDGNLRKEIKRKDNRTVYAYLNIKDKLYRADMKTLRSINLYGDIVPEKICQLHDDSSFTCKTPSQIWRDLNTFVDPEKVMEILDELNSKYGPGGLDSANKVLTQCAGTWQATSVNATGSIIQPATEHRAQMTGPEVDEMNSACRDAQLNNLTGGRGASPADRDKNYREQVNQTKKTMSQMIASCRTREEFDNSEWISFAQGAVPALTVFEYIAGGAQIGSFILDLDLMDDGWTDWTTDAPRTIEGYTTESRSALGMPEGTYKRQWRDTNSFPDKIIAFEQKELDGTKTRVEHSVTASGGNRFVITKKNSNNEVFYEEEAVEVDSIGGDYDVTVKDYRTNTVTKYRYDPHARSGKEWKKISTEPIDPKKPSGQPSAGIPNPDSRAGNCAAMEAWWKSIAAKCDMSGWQTYECSRIVRLQNHCVDAALIMPDPEGDLTCPVRRGYTAGDMLESACQRRKMFEGTWLESDCKLQQLELPITEICNDPAAMCLPDQLIIEGMDQEILSAGP